jgi:crotonobetainyl-CoA:carnitine CoA-transferase CaiB-like acyl-CoA transferase
VTPSQLFRSGDGWVLVMAQLPKFWTILCERIERRDLLDDARFRTPADRLANRDTLTEVLDAVFMREPTRHWIDLLSGHVPVAPVNDVAQALDNPFTRHMIAEVEHPDRDLRVLKSPIRLDLEHTPVSAGPLLGADTDAILGELGYDAGNIADFRAAGIV